MSAAQSAWDERRNQRIRELADKIKSPHDSQIYVGTNYSIADLRAALLATIPEGGQ